MYYRLDKKRFQDIEAAAHYAARQWIEHGCTCELPCRSDGLGLTDLDTDVYLDMISEDIETYYR